MTGADSRLPARLEVSGLVRMVEAAGGFAMVLAKGEADAGTILVVLVESGGNQRLFERMPQVDGSRRWTLVKSEDVDSKEQISEYLSRRKQQDRDLWILELDIPHGERFILNQ